MFLKKYALPILAGFCIGTTYIPFFPWALAFCLVPLWLFWCQHKDSPKTLFIGSWLTQFILNLIGFHWVAQTTIEFGGFPVIVGYIILILFAAIAHLYYPIAAVLWSWAQKRVPRPAQFLLIPLIFALCESFYPTIFFWHLGYPWLWIRLPGIHVAEWIGFYGINVFTLFLNLALLLFVILRKKRILAAALVSFVLINGLGLYLKSRFQEGEKTLDVLVVQGNIGNTIKAQQEKGTQFHLYIINKFLDLTRQALIDDHQTHPEREIDLVIWPETAYPTLIASPPRPIYNVQRKLKAAVNEWRIPLLTGAYQEENNQRDVFNSLVLLDPQGDVIKSYHKTMLLAFGEYFPGSSLIPQLIDWFPMVSNFGRGSGPTVLPFNEDLRIGAQICYESLFDDFSRSVFHQGAQMIVNVTNDSWFGTDFEPYQHLYMTLARAIEFRIPLIRSTNTGISTAISASGDIATLSPLHQEWSGVYTVKYSSLQKPTLYSYLAGAWPWTLLGLCGLILLGGYVVKPRNS
jgi:apolipoprotein N-acyltransferase